MGFIEEFKRAYAGDETQHYEVAGKEVRCHHGGENNFDITARRARRTRAGRSACPSTPSRCEAA